MQLARKLHLPALFCALAVLLCELISRPYANVGICDDGPYILMAQHLSNTGHIVYTSWPGSMLGWQLYLGAAFIKLFGFSFTVVRMSTLFNALLTAFLLQRTLVRAGINERNATLGTLAYVLSPLYLMLAVTYMSDVFGLFALVLCFYSCLRALQASTDRATISWLYFAAASNAVLGTARQFAWLGLLVMLPATLWLLRSRRRVFLAGAAATAASALFVFACNRWFQHQPYTLPESLSIAPGSEFNILSSFFHAVLELPFLLLPVALLFIPELRRNTRRSIQVASTAFVVSILILLALHWKHAEMHPLLEPFMGDWLTKYGGYGGGYMAAPIFLPAGARAVLTILSLAGLLGLATSLLYPPRRSPGTDAPQSPGWGTLGMLLAPLTVAYLLLLTSRAAQVNGLYDRYMLVLLIVALPCVIRYYQERIQPRLPTATVFLIAITAIYGIAGTHNMFSRYRAFARATHQAALSAPPGSESMAPPNNKKR